MASGSIFAAILYRYLAGWLNLLLNLSANRIKELPAAFRQSSQQHAGF
jgi:hypothetical protein